ncbi:unnamed protein product [Prorocentrum cordatum]|uniref:Uncharacterized protein n=1 Tax=Prorocentrum cordatum TaxID=2364126 RepID=A0ABN9WJJ3_9DINO|nr:unnamed protein product [Polarella glacialis]
MRFDTLCARFACSISMRSNATARANPIGRALPGKKNSCLHLCCIPSSRVPPLDNGRTRNGEIGAPAPREAAADPSGSQATPESIREQDEHGTASEKLPARGAPRECLICLARSHPESVGEEEEQEEEEEDKRRKRRRRRKTRRVKRLLQRFANVQRGRARPH